MLTEADPVDPNPPAALRAALAGILHVERTVPTIEWCEGLVLRCGGFYGPGTAISLARDAPMAAPIRKRWFPVIGDGGGVWSHVHIDDAAAATVAAVEGGQRASTTSSTASPRRCGSGCPCWRARSMPSRRDASHAGWGGSPPVRRQR